MNEIVLVTFIRYLIDYMTTSALHSFHIPVMGLGFTVATPVNVARFGISSVISIVEDELIEQMREYFTKQLGEEYTFISDKEEDYRAKRITAYLNLVNRMVNNQVEELRQLPFEDGTEIVQYFEMLPDSSPARKMYFEMIELEEGETKTNLQNQLRSLIHAGSIDVNIMSKVDKTNYGKDGLSLGDEYSDALAALRGYSKTDLHSSVVFSAGYNPRLYGYVEPFKDFFPDENGYLAKKVILKVSDYRSALTQGKIMAKKGIWISEFRIESGLNCGGHSFVSDGSVLGPILNEFKLHKETLIQELLTMCNTALEAKGSITFKSAPYTKVTVQGGIGTANEHQFLLDYFHTDCNGWGSPFLLVPEATSLDEETLYQLSNAKKEDYYLSASSPLGVPFNNFRRTSSERQRVERIEKGRPGSPCLKKFLVSNTEFTEKPICSASRQYQHLKLKQLNEQNLSAEVVAAETDAITIKDCLCEGLGAPALHKKGISPAHGSKAVVVCPGPNLAYFSGVFTLKQMADHIYGRINLLNSVKRSNMFVNELELYVDYFKKELNLYFDTANANKVRYLKNIKTNLLKGGEYYLEMSASLKMETDKYIDEMKDELKEIETTLLSLTLPTLAVAGA